MEIEDLDDDDEDYFEAYQDGNAYRERENRPQGMQLAPAANVIMKEVTYDDPNYANANHYDTQQMYGDLKASAFKNKRNSKKSEDSAHLLNNAKVEYVQAKEVPRDPHQKYGGHLAQPPQKAAAGGTGGDEIYADQLGLSYG